MLRQAGRTRPPASRDREPSIGCGVTPLPRASQVSENTGSERSEACAQDKGAVDSSTPYERASPVETVTTLLEDGGMP
jgi:hypothetical protein